MSFEFILTTDEIRERMFDFLKPLRKGYNVNDACCWDIGIFDKENNVFMTMIYYQSGLGHCADDLKCIVIVNNRDIFIAHLYGYVERDEFEIPDKYKNLRDIIKEGLIYYDDFYYLDDYDNITNEKQKELGEINKIMNKRFWDSVS